MGDAERLRRREADWIARRIRGMLDAGERIVWDKEAAAAGKPAVRAVRPGDIALLFRALSNVELYEEALRRYGIEYYLVGGRAFYGQQEVFDLLNLLRAVCSPNDEVSLAGVLRSPWFGLLDETLFWLAQHSQGLAAGLFAQRLPAELSQEQRRRVKFAAATLGELRAIKDRLPIAGWIDEALARTGFDAVLLAEFLGERKLANLRKLIEQARDFDRAGIFSMADFVTQLAEFVARQPDEALAATQPESTDVVRLMTIHQSKGLEFPVVIVPDIDRVRHGSGSLVAFTRELGPMVKDPDACGGFDLYTQTERDEEHEELLRLLYVATTRAADYLILSAGMNAAGGFARPADQETRRPGPGWSGGPWTELLNSRFDLLDGALRGRLPEGYRVPKIRVTTSEPPLRSERSGGTARPDLPKLIEEAQQMAGRGEGRVPPLVAPLAADPAARRQLSFSRLNGTLHAPVATVQPEGPAMEWDSEPLLDPRGLGTLIHAVLAEVDFANPGDIAALVRRHAQRHLPESDGELAEPIDMVRRFLASPRAAALAAAPQVHTELEFLLAWPPGQKQPAGRYLQGFIDCLYQDSAGQWHLVDYKTNRVAAGGLGAVAAGYEMQMLVYALAIERILKQPPADLTLCFLRPDLEYHFAWDDAARRRAVELVDRAIAGLAGS
jgi:ATP-dependent helicase/nuclease subunit A